MQENLRPRRRTRSTTRTGLSDVASLIDPISEAEVAWACAVMGLPADAFHGPVGDDPRLEVMRSLETLDIEACPGSGKTTLLVAKLAILANRWRSRRQGICVLSHTNAARAEIGERLSSTSAGHLLLRHPHFVGTIHSFANEFLALPWLRSKGWPITVIDSDIALNDRWRRLPWGTRNYLEQQRKTPKAMGYTQPDFSGGEKSGYKPSLDTHKHMVAVCKASTEAGYFSFDDMFVWAGELLDRHPEVIRTLRARFPVVFVDEVQDNSELQSAFLHRLFMQGDEPVVRQRFGDSNQAIYHRPGLTGAVTDAFPGAQKADLPNSFRFGQGIADLADPLGVRPQTLVGRGPTCGRIDHDSPSNVLFLFDDASILGVLPAYAEYLIETFSPDALANGDFTAIAGVHRGDKADHLPRFMRNYAPDYDPELASRQRKPTSLQQYLARARLESLASRNTHPVANRFAEGLLQFLGDAGIDTPSASLKSAHRTLVELLPEGEARKLHDEILLWLMEDRCALSKAHWTDIVLPAVLVIAGAVAGRPVAASVFLDWRDNVATDTDEPLRKTANKFAYPQKDPKVSIRLGSIHSVKGETHTATLVVESYHKAHHLQKLIPWLAGKRPKPGTDNTDEDAALIERLKLHYVAMTRPSHLLCLAMRADALKAKDLDAIKARGWRVVDCARLLELETGGR
jgi:DNA helicase-2/ATP-dependent DNA helicase PcrA